MPGTSRRLFHLTLRMILDSVPTAPLKTTPTLSGINNFIVSIDSVGQGSEKSPKGQFVSAP